MKTVAYHFNCRSLSGGCFGGSGGDSAVVDVVKFEAGQHYWGVLVITHASHRHTGPEGIHHHRYIVPDNTLAAFIRIEKLCEALG